MPGTVRAKFYVAEKNVRANRGNVGDQAQTIVLYPVTSGSPENEQFYRFTPGGRIELSVVNEEAGNKFELGKECYVDFTFED